MSPLLRALVATALPVALSLIVATAAVWLVEGWTGLDNASVLYLVAVVACGLVAGTAAAIVAAIGAFLVYTFLFTEPVHTFAVNDPQVLLTVLLLLFVGIVVGQLVSLQRVRATTAEAREHEARALFGLSRALATRASTGEALVEIARALRDETGMARVWITLGPDPGTERLVADSEPGPARDVAIVSTGSNSAAPARVRVLQRRPGSEPARWSLVVQPGAGRRGPSANETYRVRIEASGEAIGSLWATRARHLGEPDRVHTRLLGAAADQVGQAIASDRLAAASESAEVARQSDALKSSLLQSVSHDFRTPLAVIRAAAGSLDEAHGLPVADRRANLAAIDREVQYLDRLVANLLDLGRIEAGSLRAHTDVFDVEDLVSGALERVRPRLGGRALEVALASSVVRVDPVFLDAALANLLDNALTHTPPGTVIRVTTPAADVEHVVLRVEDDGPGVPPEAMSRLFTRFYRVPGAHADARGGLGIGLAVVRGLVEATGGSATAGRSVRGGLAIDLALPAAGLAPGELSTGPGVAEAQGVGR